METEDPPDFISCTCKSTIPFAFATLATLPDLVFAFVGAELRCAVGGAVGLFVGVSVGAIVGGAVGGAVGAFDGGAVGDAVGAIDGGAVRDAVGAVEGDLVGLIEGDEVGSFVGSPGHFKFESTTFQHFLVLAWKDRLQMAPVPVAVVSTSSAPEHTDTSNKPPLSRRQLHVPAPEVKR